MGVLVSRDALEERVPRRRLVVRHWLLRLHEETEYPVGRPPQSGWRSSVTSISSNAALRQLRPLRRFVLLNR
jgi:hypothetical protein